MTDEKPFFGDKNHVQDDCLKDLPQFQIAEENDPDIVAAQRTIQFIEDAMHILNSYQINQGLDASGLRMSFRCMMLVLGFNLVADADGLSELAQKTGNTKQAVGKCANQFLSQLKLTPMLSQRDEESRENMSKARKEQVG